MRCGDNLFELFEHPIERVSQLMRCESNSDSLPRAWGGLQPVLAIQFADAPGRDVLLLTTGGDEIEWRIADSRSDLMSEIVSFARSCGPEWEEEEPILGLFDLDIALSPDPSWQHLRITKAALVRRNTPEQDRPLLGFCLWVNLGMRIGSFVPPHNGLTLAFNDSCDVILDRSREAAERGLVTVETRDYRGRETPGQMPTIDWWDWLKR